MKQNTLIEQSLRYIPGFESGTSTPIYLNLLPLYHYSQLLISLNFYWTNDSCLSHKNRSLKRDVGIMPEYMQRLGKRIKHYS